MNSSTAVAKSVNATAVAKSVKDENIIVARNTTGSVNEVVNTKSALDFIKGKLNKEIKQTYQDESEFENKIDMAMDAPSEFEAKMLQYHKQWKLDEFTVAQCEIA